MQGNHISQQNYCMLSLKTVQICYTDTFVASAMFSISGETWWHCLVCVPGSGWGRYILKVKQIFCDKDCEQEIKFQVNICICLAYSGILNVKQVFCDVIAKQIKFEVK